MPVSNVFCIGNMDYMKTIPDYFADSCKAFDCEINGIIQQKGHTVTQAKLF